MTCSIIPLFKAYFTEGKNVNDTDTLLQLGIEIGLSAIEVGELLSSDAYAADVQEDIQKAQALGINGVPFFVINDKYGISGAQPKELFGETLENAWKEQPKPSIITINSQDNDSCTGDGCEVKSGH